MMMIFRYCTEPVIYLKDADPELRALKVHEAILLYRDSRKAMEVF